LTPLRRGGAVKRVDASLFLPEPVIHLEARVTLVSARFSRSGTLVGG
jgi:hypothetical protein